MKRKCPRCGSSDVAEYRRGLPACSERLDKGLADHKVILGERCITVNDPSAHCNACGRDFGKPPFLRRHRGQAEDAPCELLPDIVIGIVFSEGGYFGGHDVVKITTDENGHHSVYMHYPDFDSGLSEPYSRDIGNAQWKRLMDALYYKLCIHEWKKRYVDPHVCDGTQWGLELKMTKGRHYSIYGSNDFLALYKDLVRTFTPFMKKAMQG